MLPTSIYRLLNSQQLRGRTIICKRMYDDLFSFLQSIKMPITNKLKWGWSHNFEDRKESYNFSFKSLSDRWNTNTGNKMLLYMQGLFFPVYIIYSTLMSSRDQLLFVLLTTPTGLWRIYGVRTACTERVAEALNHMACTRDQTDRWRRHRTSRTLCPWPLTFTVV